MDKLDFFDLLRLIDERVAAFRVAVEAAPDLDARVVTCPEWTLRDLVRHLGEGRRKWAAIVAAGPATAPPAGSVWQDPPSVSRERAVSLDRVAVSTRQLLEALRAAGPDRGCWAWWAGSGSPMTSGAAARHQLQEVAVHTYDAQVTAGAPQPLPDEVALDGVDEFLATCCTTPVAWPYEPAVVDYHATEGCSWRVHLTADGVRSAVLAGPVAGAGPADASARGSASELVLLFYGRVPLDALELAGDRRHFERLIEWDPDQ